jgi:hypothetical protein
LDDSYFNCSSVWIGAVNIMAMGRSQMSQQISKPPNKKKKKIKIKVKKNAKRRLLQKS